MFRSDWILARHGPLMLIPLLWLMAAMATTYPKFKSLKSFRQNPRMLRGQQVETASYSVEFEPHGSCKVLRACDPPCEITFPGWSRRSRPGMRSPMAVEAIKAICASDLMDGSHPVLFARAVIVPNAPFQKLLAVANLRKLLKTHLPENFKNVMEAGSTLYRLDVDGSDHDIEVVFKNIPDDQQIVDLLLAGMTAAQLDAQQRVSGFKTKSKDYHELAAARSFSEIILKVEVEWQSHHGFSFESCLRQYLWGVQTAYIRIDHPSFFSDMLSWGHHDTCILASADELYKWYFLWRNFAYKMYKCACVSFVLSPHPHLVFVKSTLKKLWGPEIRGAMGFLGFANIQPAKL